MKIKFEHVVYRKHAIERMFERNISTAVVRLVLTTGEIIASYPEDKPYPSYLLLGWHNYRPIHIVAAMNKNDSEVIIITAYEPERSLWQTGFRRKK